MCLPFFSRYGHCGGLLLPWDPWHDLARHVQYFFPSPLGKALSHERGQVKGEPAPVLWTHLNRDSRGTYGSPRVHAELRAREQRVSRKRVARLMNEQDLAARKRRRFVRTTDSRHNQPVAPNILERNFSPGQPDCTWATDITYVETKQGWLYLAVVMDLFSRKVVGWSMSERIDRHLVLNALDMALKGRQPPRGLLHHSDRGSQYASTDY